MDVSQLLKGILPTTALAVIAEGDSYGYQVLNDLRIRGLSTVGDASVYGTLQRLYDAGLVSSYVVASPSGPKRKYYAVTAEGTHVLTSDRKEWRSFRTTVDLLLGSSDEVAR